MQLHGNQHNSYVEECAGSSLTHEHGKTMRRHRSHFARLVFLCFAAAMLLCTYKERRLCEQTSDCIFCCTFSDFTRLHCLSIVKFGTHQKPFVSPTCSLRGGCFDYIRSAHKHTAQGNVPIRRFFYFVYLLENWFSSMLCATECLMLHFLATSSSCLLLRPISLAFGNGFYRYSRCFV